MHTRLELRLKVCLSIAEGLLEMLVLINKIPEKEAIESLLPKEAEVKKYIKRAKGLLGLIEQKNLTEENINFLRDEIADLFSEVEDKFIIFESFLLKSQNNAIEKIKKESSFLLDDPLIIADNVAKEVNGYIEFPKKQAMLKVKSSGNGKRLEQPETMFVDLEHFKVFGRQKLEEAFSAREVSAYVKFVRKFIDSVKRKHKIRELINDFSNIVRKIEDGKTAEENLNNIVKILSEISNLLKNMSLDLEKLNLILKDLKSKKLVIREGFIPEYGRKKDFLATSKSMLLQSMMSGFSPSEIAVLPVNQSSMEGSSSEAAKNMKLDSSSKVESRKLEKIDLNEEQKIILASLKAQAEEIMQNKYKVELLTSFISDFISLPFTVRQNKSLYFDKDQPESAALFRVLKVLRMNASGMRRKDEKKSARNPLKDEADQNSWKFSNPDECSKEEENFLEKINAEENSDLLKDPRQMQVCKIFRFYSDFDTISERSIDNFPLEKIEIEKKEKIICLDEYYKLVYKPLTKNLEAKLLIIKNLFSQNFLKPVKQNGLGNPAFFVETGFCACPQEKSNADIFSEELHKIIILIRENLQSLDSSITNINNINNFKMELQDKILQLSDSQFNSVNSSLEIIKNLTGYIQTLTLLESTIRYTHQEIQPINFKKYSC